MPTGAVDSRSSACPSSSEAQTGRRRGRHYVRVALPSAPSPTLAKMTADGAGWHAIGCAVRDLVGAVLSSWFQSELQHHHAHRRGQLPQEGVRSTSGGYAGKRLLAPPLLAFAPYNNRYLHTVNRCGRRLATNFLINGSTSSISMACCIMVNAQFETLIYLRSWKFRVFLWKL